MSDSCLSRSVLSIFTVYLLARLLQYFGITDLIVKAQKKSHA